MQSTSRLGAVLAALGRKGAEQTSELLPTASQCLEGWAQLYPARRLTTATAAGRARNAAAPLPGAAGQALVEPISAPPEPPSKVRRGRPLKTRTVQLLQREALVASFAAQLGLRDAEPAESAAASYLEAAAAAGAVVDRGEGWEPPASTRSQAEELMRRRQNRRPQYPAYEVYEAWLAAHEQQLQPLRDYLAQRLQMNAEVTIALLFRKGRHAQALMMPEPPPLLFELDGEEAPKKNGGKGRGLRKKKKAGEEQQEAGAEATVQPEPEPPGGEGRAKKGRKKKGAEQEVEAAAEPPAEQGAQVPQAGEALPAPALPRLAAVAAEWEAVLAAAQLPLPALGALAAKCPALLVERPPGSVQRVLRQLALVKELLQLGNLELAEFVGSAPQILLSSQTEVVRRLQFLREHLQLEQEPGKLLHKEPRLLVVPEGMLTENVRVLAQYCRSTSAFSTLVKWHPELLAKATPRRLAALLHNLGELLPEGFDPTEVVRARPLMLLTRPRFVAANWQELRGICEQVPTWKQELEQVLAVPASAQQQPQQAQAAAVPAEGAAVGEAQQEGGNEKKRRKMTKDQKALQQQYHELGRLLDAGPDRLRRLRFLLEVHPAAADLGGESLVELLTMRPRVFERNFPGLKEWAAARAAERQAAGLWAEGEFEALEGESDTEEAWGSWGPPQEELAAEAAEAAEAVGETLEPSSSNASSSVDAEAAGPGADEPAADDEPAARQPWDRSAAAAARWAEEEEEDVGALGEEERASQQGDVAPEAGESIVKARSSRGGKRQSSSAQKERRGRRKAEAEEQGYRGGDGIDDWWDKA